MSDEKKKLDEDSLRAVRDWTNGKFARTPSICPVYDEEALYDAGDLVSHDGILYQCIEDETSGEWDETKWSDTSISVELFNIKYGITHLFERITDSAGNLRFIEFGGDVNSVEGVTITYSEAALSGTHMMVVLVGSIANGTILTNGTVLCRFDIHTYISNKIHPVFSNVVETKVANAYANDWSTQALEIALQKGTNVLSITKVGDLTLTANRNFRIQFDLLIDADYE